MLKIFVADDNPHVHRIVEQTLGEDGCEVAGVYEGAGALQRLERFQPNLALLDAGLPMPDGPELCDAILARRDLSGVRIVMLLGPLEAVEEGDEPPPGVHAVVQKPLDPAMLRDLVSGIAGEIAPEEEPSDMDSSQQVIDRLVQEALGAKDDGGSRELIREQVEAALATSVPMIIDRITDRLVAHLRDS